ncbi:MAG: hypothetical protein ACXWUP_06580 [Allosphingosinicella sp.]
MNDPILLLILVATATIAISILAAVALKVWRDWLDLKHRELDPTKRPTPAARDLTDLRQRIRRLESIADGDG